MGIFAQADKIIYIQNDPLNVLVRMRMLFHDSLFLLNHKPWPSRVFFHFEVYQKNNIFQKLTKMARRLQKFPNLAKCGVRNLRREMVRTKTFRFCNEKLLTRIHLAAKDSKSNQNVGKTRLNIFHVVFVP